MNEKLEGRILVAVLSSIICVGLLGNLLNFVVLTRKAMKNNSTFRFLFYLSIIDFCVLVFCSTDILFVFWFNFQVRLQSMMFCRLHSFFTYYLTHMSSVVLMAISVDRVFAVCNDSIGELFRKKKKSKVKDREKNEIDIVPNGPSNLIIRLRLIKDFMKMNRVGIIMTILSVALGLINIHFLFLMNLNTISLHKSVDQIDWHDRGLDMEMNIRKRDSSSEYSIDVVLMNLTAILDADEEFKDDQNMINITTDHFDIINVKEGTVSMCFPHYKSNYFYFLSEVWIWIDISLYCIIPFSVMIFCSTIIFIEITRRTNHFTKYFSTLNRTLTQKRIRRKRQIFFMLTATNLLFIVSSLPYCILSYRSNRGDDTNHSHLMFTNALVYLKNAFNFIIFGLFSRNYRHELTNIRFFQRLTGQKTSNRIIVRKRSSSAMPSPYQIRKSIVEKRDSNVLNFTSSNRLDLVIDEINVNDTKFMRNRSSLFSIMFEVRAIN